MGEAGTMMPERCVPENRCGTNAPGWLNGEHPWGEGGIVTRQVCYKENGDCCAFKNDIRIRNCGAYFVYQLQKPLGCSRYCGDNDGKYLPNFLFS